MGNSLYTKKNSGVWAADKFQCSGAIGRNTTGNGGDFNNYCIFNSDIQAGLECDKDLKCVGYVTNSPTHFQLTRTHPIPSSINGTFYEKSYAQSETGVWATDKYQCPGATGRNITGNGGDFNNYCMFDNNKDAVTQCTSDPKCVGFLSGSDFKSQTTRTQPAPSSTNGTFYGKLHPTPPVNTSTCYNWTADDEANFAKGYTQQEVCASIPGGVFTEGNNTNYPGCGTCWCCNQTGVTTSTPLPIKETPTTPNRPPPTSPSSVSPTSPSSVPPTSPPTSPSSASGGKETEESSNALLYGGGAVVSVGSSSCLCLLIIIAIGVVIYKKTK
jgi:hypothetical protein